MQVMPPLASQTLRTPCDQITSNCILQIRNGDQLSARLEDVNIRELPLCRVANGAFKPHIWNRSTRAISLEGDRKDCSLIYFNPTGC